MEQKDLRKKQRRSEKYYSNKETKGSESGNGDLDDERQDDQDLSATEDGEYFVWTSLLLFCHSASDVLMFSIILHHCCRCLCRGGPSTGYTSWSYSNYQCTTTASFSSY